MPPTLRRRLLPHTIRGRVALGLALLAAALALLLVYAGFFDRNELRLFPTVGAERAQVGVLYVSGDMGLRFGMGPYVANAIARSGIPVVGLSSSTAFATHRSRGELEAIVDRAVRATLARTGKQRLILIGQSFGADILQTGLATLPQPLRARIAAVVLVVPGRTVFFRADPTSIAYRGTPDSNGPDTVRTIDWAPLTCIQGARESDSLCPWVTQPNARRIVLPGGHFLNHDQVIATVFRAIRAVTPIPGE